MHLIIVTQRHVYQTTNNQNYCNHLDFPSINYFIGFYNQINKRKQLFNYLTISYICQLKMDEQKAPSRHKNSVDISKLDIQFHLSMKSGMRTNYGNRLNTRSLHRGDTQKSQQNYQSIQDKLANHQNASQANLEVNPNLKIANTVNNIRYSQFNSTNSKMSKTRSDFNNISVDEANRSSHSFNKCPSFIPKYQRSNSVNINHTRFHDEKSKLDALDSFQIKWIGTRPVNTGNNFSEKNLFPARKKKSGTQMLINMLVKHANRQEMQLMRYTKLKQQAQQKQNAKSKPKYGYLSEINKVKGQSINHNSNLRNLRRKQYQKPLQRHFKIGLASNNNQ